MPIPEPVVLDAASPQFFAEAVDYFRRQAPWISGSSWTAMADLAAKKGDQVSGAAMLRMMDDIWARMDRAVAEGLPYSEFVREIGRDFRRDWVGVESPRLRLIYHNNVGSALMAGRMAQVTDPDVISARPYLLFDAIEDMRTSDVCLERDGKIIRADDPWWRTNTPLLHHNCRSSVISLDEEDASELGGVTPASRLRGMEPAQKGWGSPHSWEDWRPKEQDYHPALFREYEDWREGRAYAQDLDSWHSRLKEAEKEGLKRNPASEDKIIAPAAPEIRTTPEKKKSDARVEELIRYYLDQWVIGSKRKASVTLKKAVIQEFGMQGVVAYSRVNWKISDEDVQAAQAAAREIYEDSQQALKAAGIQKVTLYRGVQRGYAVQGSLESWTTDAQLAKKFNGGPQGGVEMVEAPASRVFAFSGGPHWINGKYGEQYEYVLLAEDAS